MRKKLKNRLTVILIMLSFLVISAISITVIFALTQQNISTEVGVEYYPTTPIEAFTFTDNEDETWTLSSFDKDYEGSVIIPATYNNQPVTSIGSSAFYNCDGLTSITIPDSVTSIEGYAFYNCDSLTSITIPENVTSIGDYAFGFCRGLTSVTIGSGVTSIGNRAFFYCTGLKKVITPDVNKWVKINFNDREANPLKYGGNLYSTDSENPITEIILSDGVTSIGNHTFTNCRELTKITIPESVTSIGEAAFSSCIGLTRVTIPDSVTSIGDDAFFYCTGLTSVTIGSGVTSIGNHAFHQCYGLKSITIPDSVISIGEWAFSYCRGLTRVTIPENVTSIGSSAFADCDNLTSISVVEGNEKYSSKDLRGEEKNCIIETASKTLIAGCKTSKIPTDGSVTSIGDGAFEDCVKLTSITIPNSVTSIGDSAFKHCTGLTEIEIPNSVTEIGDHAFFGSGLTSITIPDSVISIGEQAFYSCDNLTSVKIGSGVEFIGQYAFQFCSNLTNVTFENPNGWFIAYSADATSGTDLNSTDLSNTSTAATYLKSKYSGSYWSNKVTLLDFEFNDTENGYVITGYDNSLEGALVIPNYYNGNAGETAIIGIAEAAFKDCTGLISVTFENPNNWYVAVSLEAPRENVPLTTNAADNAGYFKSEYYNTKYWLVEYH